MRGHFSRDGTSNEESTRRRRRSSRVPSERDERGRPAVPPAPLTTARLARAATPSELRARLAEAGGSSSSSALNVTHMAAAMAACARIARLEENKEEASAARYLAQELYSSSSSRLLPLLTRLSLRDAASLLASAASLGIGGGGGDASAALLDAASHAVAESPSHDGRCTESVALALSAAARMRLPAPGATTPTTADDDDGDNDNAAPAPATLLLSRLLLPSSSYGDEPLWPAPHAARAIQALAELLPRWQCEFLNARRLAARRRGGRNDEDGNGDGDNIRGEGNPPKSSSTLYRPLALPVGWFEAALRATLPLLEEQEQEEEQDDDDNDEERGGRGDRALATASSLLVAAAALAPFDPSPSSSSSSSSSSSLPRRRRRPHQQQRAFSGVVPCWWAAAWLSAAERALPDASAAQLTRALDALAESGALLDAWPSLVGDDEEEEEEAEQEDEATPATTRPTTTPTTTPPPPSLPLVLRRRQRHFLRAAYGQLYFTADQFSAAQLGRMLSRPLSRLAMTSSPPHPPAALAARLAAYAVSKAAAAVAVVAPSSAATASSSSSKEKTCDEVRGAISGAGHALRGLADIYRLKTRTKTTARRRKGALSPPPPPPPSALDARLLSAARAAVLEPGAQALVRLSGDDAHDDDASRGARAVALVDLLGGMAALEAVMGGRQGGQQGEKDDDEEEEEEAAGGSGNTSSPVLAILGQGASRLSPHQVACALDALVGLGIISSKPCANTAQSLWLRSLLRASALRLRACRDAVAVAGVAASVARLCEEDEEEEFDDSAKPTSPPPFHPGRSWTLRTLLPAAAASTARLGPATVVAAAAVPSLLRALAVLLPPLVVRKHCGAGTSRPPYDCARLVTQLRAAVVDGGNSDRGGAGRSTAAAAAARQQQQQEKQQERVRRDLAAVEAALEAIDH